MGAWFRKVPKVPKGLRVPMERPDLLDRPAPTVPMALRERLVQPAPWEQQGLWDPPVPPGTTAPPARLARRERLVLPGQRARLAPPEPPEWTVQLERRVRLVRPATRVLQDRPDQPVLPDRLERPGPVALRAPLGPIFTLAMPQSLPEADKKASASRRSVVKIHDDSPWGTSLCISSASSKVR